MGAEAAPLIPTYPTMAPSTQGGIPFHYPVAAVSTPEGSSGGLVNKSAQIIAAAQAGQNATNQREQMAREGITFQQQQDEQHASSAYDNEQANIPGPNGNTNGTQPSSPAAPGSHAGFFQALENSPIAHVVGGAIRALGIPLPAPAGGASPGQAPATPAATPNANAGTPNVPQVAQMAQRGGVVQEPEFMHPQPQPVMVGMAHGGVVGATKAPARAPLASPRFPAFRTRRTLTELDSPKSGIPGPALDSSVGAGKGAAPRSTGFSVVQGSPQGVPGFAEGGVIPVQSVPTNPGSSGNLVNSSGQEIAAAQAGQNSANQQQQMDQSGQQFAQEQHSRAAAQQAFVALVNEHHGDLHSMGLNEKGQRNDSQGVPASTPATDPGTAAALNAPPPDSQPAQGATPPPSGAPPSPATAGGTGQSPATNSPPPAAAPAGGAPAPGAAVAALATKDAVTKAQSDPGAAQGQPETPDAPTHSISTEEWDRLDNLRWKAAAAAAAAGHDGNAVYQSLQASTNAWVQGHILRNLSAANEALLNHDQDGVKKALQDANYYLPNGQNLKIQTDKDGNLVYQDPIHPFLDSNGMPTYSPKTALSGGPALDNVPNMIPVDAAHLQQLGTAMLDPMNVQNTIMAARQAVAQQQLFAQRGQSYVIHATAQLHLADARATQADTQRLLVPSEVLRNKGSADLDEARAQYAGALLQYRRNMQVKADPVTAHNMTLASGAVMDMARGAPSVQPGMIDGTPNPSAGKPTFDPSRIPPELRSADAGTLNGIAATAQELVQARNLPPQAAAEQAVSLFRSQHMQHTEVYGGKKITRSDFQVSKDGIWQWDPAHGRWNPPIQLSPYGMAQMTAKGFHGMASVSDAETAAVMGNGGSGSTAIPPAGSGDSSDAADAQAVNADPTEGDTQGEQ
jgi:hypothetical protein